MVVVDIPPEAMGQTASVDTATGISNFIQGNLMYFAILGVAIFLFFAFFKIRKPKNKIVDRTLIEKNERIKELAKNNNVIPEYWMSENDRKEVRYNKYTFLKHGSRLLGKIMNIAKRTTVGNPDPKNNYEIVFKPPMFSLFGHSMFFFKKMEIIRVAEEELHLMPEWRTAEIKPDVTIDSHMGVYYDVPHEKENINWINENLFKHDKETLSNFYYVEAQKRSTFDTDYAHEVVMEEKKLQTELAKRRGKLTSI